MKELSALEDDDLKEIAKDLLEKEERDERVFEMMEKLIFAVRALRTEPSKTIVQPKIVMPEFTPTINVQASEVTVPHTVQVMPSQVNYPARPTKWRFSISRNRFNQIDEITAEAVK